MASNQNDLDFPVGPALQFLRHLWHVNHAVERRSNRMGKDLGLTVQQRLTLRCIGRFSGITAGQLAQLLCIDPGTLSASLRRLEQRGFIERARDPNDTRRVTLALTRQGREFDTPRAGTAEAAADRLLAELPPEALSTTAQVLARFCELLESAEPE
jgi:DNA-binding MarR family transcriptional regulator